MILCTSIFPRHLQKQKKKFKCVKVVFDKYRQQWHIKALRINPQKVFDLNLLYLNYAYTTYNRMCKSKV